MMRFFFPRLITVVAYDVGEDPSAFEDLNHGVEEEVTGPWQWVAAGEGGPAVFYQLTREMAEEVRSVFVKRQIR